MAILHRFGSADEFDPNKMQVRELAYVNTTNQYYKAGLYLCYAPGDVRRQTTEQDIINILNTSTEAYTALQQLLSDLELNPSELTNILSNISNLQTNKLDKVGDTKDNTTTFTEFATDTDIVSGEKHSTFLSKILKSIKTLRSGKIDKTSITQTDTTNDITKIPSSAVTYAHGLAIAAQNNNLAGLVNSMTYPVNTTPVAIGYFNGLPVYRKLCAVTTTAIAGATTDSGAHGIGNIANVVRVYPTLYGIEARTRKYIYAYADTTNVYAYCLDGGSYVGMQAYTVYIEYTVS